MEQAFDWATMISLEFCLPQAQNAYAMIIFQWLVKCTGNICLEETIKFFRYQLKSLDTF